MSSSDMNVQHLGAGFNPLSLKVNCGRRIVWCLENWMPTKAISQERALMVAI
jgi:hypothetical protein